MYNIIHANQQDTQWKQYSLFSVYQVDELENYNHMSICGCAFYFQFGINLLI